MTDHDRRSSFAAEKAALAALLSNLAAIREAISEDAPMGRVVADAIASLDLLRQQLEERPNP